MRQGLLAASVAVGLGVLGEFLAAEVTEKAGPKGRHDPHRTAFRHGTNGRRCRWAAGGCRRQAPAASRGRVRARSASTCGTRRRRSTCCPSTWSPPLWRGCRPGTTSEAALEQVGDVAARSTAKSTVSARFVAATRARLDELRDRSLAGRRWLVVYVDGFDFAGQTMVGALGVDADGNKVPLGIIQGTTENETVCRDLLAQAKDRGLDATGGCCSCSMAPKRCTPPCGRVRRRPVQIQRCRRHKSENIVGYLPAAEKGWVRRQLAAAWAEPDPAEARAALRELARKLDRLNPDAAASLREGLEETITINRLGIGGTLGRDAGHDEPDGVLHRHRPSARRAT